MINPLRQCIVKIGAFAKILAQEIQARRTDIGSGAEPQRMHFGLGNFAHTPEFPDRQGRCEVGSLMGKNHHQTIGFAHG